MYFHCYELKRKYTQEIDITYFYKNFESNCLRMNTIILNYKYIVYVYFICINVNN